MNNQNYHIENTTGVATTVSGCGSGFCNGGGKRYATLQMLGCCAPCAQPIICPNNCVVPRNRGRPGGGRPGGGRPGGGRPGGGRSGGMNTGGRKVDCSQWTNQACLDAWNVCQDCSDEEACRQCDTDREYTTCCDGLGNKTGGQKVDCSQWTNQACLDTFYKCQDCSDEEQCRYCDPDRGDREYTTCCDGLGNKNPNYK